MIIVGIAGGSGSGKTTVARAVMERLGSQRAAMITHDAYYLDLRHLTDGERAQVNFDHPAAFESERLAADLAGLRAGRVAEIPVYDFTRHLRRPETRRVEPRPVVLVEGILVLADDRIRPLLDLAVYVDAPADLRLARRLRRDTQDRGRTVDSVLDQYEATVRPMHQRLVEPSGWRADVVILEGGWNRDRVDGLVARLQALAGLT